MFADDVQIWKGIKSAADEDEFQKNLCRLKDWSRKWLLSFNSNKCTLLRLRNRNPVPDARSYHLIAHCCRVSSLQEVSLFISKMLEDGKVANATHNITAWYLRAKLRDSSNTLSLVADFDDDGEAHAGARLLHLLTMAANEGIAVMVSRWFGGIKLGPDRFKHINNAASSLLAEQKMLKSTDPPKSKAKNKGKR
ncbi:unnamed protein product [Dibothriocephalus latus]|uniref:Impact N-terminal domain-containing protein n=1 Tax=Dibothriocephalus latus TaxID=60516 RepID=A0A3P7LSM3_DIBLA|nr:unnamed protein product [Dibothriocephalus latus]